MAGNPNPQNQITPESRANMPARGKSQKSLILAAIKDRCGSIEEYWAQVVDMSHSEPSIKKMLCDKLAASMRPVSPTFKLDLPKGATAAQKAQAIEDAVFSGELPADVAAQMLGSIKTSLEILTNAELAERLEKTLAKLEAQQ